MNSRMRGVLAVLALLPACGRLGFEDQIVPGGRDGAEPWRGDGTARDGDAATDSRVTSETSDGSAAGIADAGAGAVTDAALPTGDVARSIPPPGQLTWTPLVGGTFDMGSTAAANSQPVHAVTVPNFEIGSTEVTVAQYVMCMDAGGCSAPDRFTQACYWSDAAYGSYPVNCVSHTQAAEFCTWAGGRLPSEAEWEYAARSRGKPQRYPWGDAPASCGLATLSIGGDGCGTGLPRPVCSAPQGNTSDGLCDMAGNVFEWTLDGWHASYDGAPSDGNAWSGSNFVVRGGSYLSGAWTSSQRGVYFGPTYLNTFIGFRCVR